jgi:hypothetical protein
VAIFREKPRLGISFLRIKKYQKISKNIKNYQKISTTIFSLKSNFFQNFRNFQKIILQKF